MHVTRSDDPDTFRAAVLPRLLDHEAHNCVILGVLARVTDPALRRPDEPLPLMAVVEDESGAVLAAATMNRPYPIVVSPSPTAAAAALAGHLAEHGIAVPGITAEMATAQAFAESWVRRAGGQCRVDTRLGLYQLDQLVPPATVPGNFRQAVVEDTAVLLPFAEGFYRDVRESLPDAGRQLERAIRERRLFVWCDSSGRIVSMAAFAGPTPNGIRVNFVFTPAELRGRGYASNCVAALTRQLLNSGRKLVFLFTDLTNPTSNRIYQAIGYRYLGEQQKILFERSAR